MYNIIYFIVWKAQNGKTGKNKLATDKRKKNMKICSTEQK